MVQETAIAEGTDSMFDEQANDNITNLQQAGANIDNLQQACTSTSTSGGSKKRRNKKTKKNKKTKRKKRNKKNKETKKNKSKITVRRRTRKMKGGNKDHLMPPLFTNMYKYIKKKQLNEVPITKEELEEVPITEEEIIKLKSETLQDEDLKNFINLYETTKGNGIDYSEYKRMCKNLFQSDEGKYYRIENIVTRMGTPSEKLLFMNFKSHNIFIPESRKKLFDIIAITKPKYICLTEALVPISIADKANKYAKIQSKMRLDEPDMLKKESLESIIEAQLQSEVLEEQIPEMESYDIAEDEKDTNTIAIVDIAYIHNLQSPSEDIVQQPYKAYKTFTEKKKTVASLDNTWIETFKGLGYNYVIFANPRRCPYGKNWGNCIISQDKPISAKVVQMTPIKKHSPSALAAQDDPETRCMIHVEFKKDNILCTHFEDTDQSKRIAQTAQVINYINNSVYSTRKGITLVGDLNAINSMSYEQNEINLLNKLTKDKNDVPTDAVNSLTSFFNASSNQVQLINNGQKYESLYQKCVSHAYSNMYKKSLMIFTDATDFDHQPLLLLKYDSSLMSRYMPRFMSNPITSQTAAPSIVNTLADAQSTPPAPPAQPAISEQPAPPAPPAPPDQSDQSEQPAEQKSFFSRLTSFFTGNK
jgi:hypothetical protein